MPIRFSQRAYSRYLGRVRRAIVAHANQEIGTPSHPDNRPTIHSTQSRKKAVVVTQDTITKRAFAYTFKVPIGGFRAKDYISAETGRPLRAFPMQKPESAKPVFRARTYVKFGGQTVRRTGYLEEAIEQVLERRGGPGHSALKLVTRQQAEAVAGSIARSFRAAGYRVRVRKNLPSLTSVPEDTRMQLLADFYEILTSALGDAVGE